MSHLLMGYLTIMLDKLGFDSSLGNASSKMSSGLQTGIYFCNLRLSQFQVYDKVPRWKHTEMFFRIPDKVQRERRKENPLRSSEECRCTRWRSPPPHRVSIPQPRTPNGWRDTHWFPLFSLPASEVGNPARTNEVRSLKKMTWIFNTILIEQSITWSYCDLHDDLRPTHSGCSRPSSNIISKLPRLGRSSLLINSVNLLKGPTGGCHRLTLILESPPKSRLAVGEGEGGDRCVSGTADYLSQSKPTVQWKGCVAESSWKLTWPVSDLSSPGTTNNGSGWLWLGSVSSPDNSWSSYNSQDANILLADNSRPNFA